MTCLISITVATGDGRTVEVAAVGNREVLGINALMGARETTQTEYMVQVPGDRISDRDSSSEGRVRAKHRTA